MKRKMIFAAFLIVMSFVLSGCFLFTNHQSNFTGNVVSAKLIGDHIQFVSNVNAKGIEVTLSAKGITSQDVTFQKGMLGIVASRPTCTKIAVAKTSGHFSKGEPIFIVERKLSLNSLISNEKYSNMESKQVKALDTPYPLGLSIDSTQMALNSEVLLKIHAAGLTNISGMKIILNYDPSLLSIDQSQGIQGVTPLTSIQTGKLIVENPYSGLIEISIAFSNSINIDNDDILAVSFKSNDKIGKSEINFGSNTEVEDSNLNKVNVDTTNGAISVVSLKLLGDFNTNGEVGLSDFIEFAQHYDTEYGNVKYEKEYDIYPAQQLEGYSVWNACSPDGKIDLDDFIVFAQNYLKTLPPTSPSNLRVVSYDKNSIDIAWTDNSNNEDGFEIWRSTDGKSYNKIGTVGTNVTTYNDINLSEGVSYYYKIRAFKGDERSGFSNFVLQVPGRSSPYFPIRDGQIDKTEIFNSVTTLTQTNGFGTLDHPILSEQDVEYQVDSVDSTSIKYKMITSLAYMGMPNSLQNTYFLVSKNSSAVYMGIDGYMMRVIDGINGNTPGATSVVVDNMNVSRISSYIPEMQLGNNTYTNVLEVMINGDTDLYFERGIGLIKIVYYNKIDNQWEPVTGFQISSTNIGTFENNPDAATLISPNNIISDPNSTITLKWNSSSPGKYNVYIGPKYSQNGEGIEEIKSDLSSTSVNIGPLSTGTYVWTVVNIDSNGLSTVSKPMYFSVESSEDIVNIPDAGLRQAVLDALGKSSTPIYKSDLMNLTSLDASNRNVKELDGIKYCINLKSLILEKDEISDITPLENLTKLATLEVDDNHISNVNPLTHLKNLKTLWIDGNPISDFNPIGELTSLEILTMNNDNIYDISFLEKLKNLQMLFITSNHISDISPLKYLTSLKVISLSNNDIENITPLGSLTNLYALYLWNNNVKNISVLQNLKNLEILLLTRNEVDDITPLEDLTRLEDVYLANNKIKDISSLASLTNISNLYLNNNDITNIAPLTKEGLFSNQAKLNISYNYLDLSSTTVENEINKIKEEGVTVTASPQKSKTQPPYNLRVVSFSSTQITLKWDNDNIYWKYFILERSLNNENYDQIATTTNLTYEDTTVASGNTYYYKVIAFNSNEYSTPTNIVKVTATKDSEVTIPDAGLRQAILDALGKSSTPIYKSDLMSLTGLNASGRGITDLEGIQYCTSLQSLDLSNNDITDISKLASLTNLTYLRVPQNSALSNISPIASLTNLKWLDIWNDNISDISVLANLISLQHLDMAANKISSLKPIEDLKKITYLHVSSNPLPVSSIQFLGTWTQLKELALGNLGLSNSDIQFLSNLKSLHVLLLFNDKLTNLDFLNNMNLKNVTWLDMEGNDITDISPLMKNGLFASGADLDISNNYLDISDGSTTMNDINTLQSGGVNVTYQPQKGQPQPPYNLSIVSFSSTQITLQWEDGNDDWQYFAVARSDTQDFSSYTVVGTTTQKTFEDTTVASGNTYYYAVAAVNPVGNSSPTNSVKVTAMEDSEVTIPDAGLRQAILDALGKSSTPIYRSDLMSLTGLNASGRSITNLEGIQYCTNLQWLDLSNNNITDISKLASLTNLEYIGIQGNHNLSDISPLRYLTSLTSINMYENNISDISALASLTNLQHIDMGVNKISNLDAIKGLTNLTDLRISSNPLSADSIQFLGTWTRLTGLAIGNLNLTINDIQFLSNLTNLEELLLFSNHITDMSALVSLLSGMNNLHRLMLDGNGITDISPLASLTSLTNLSLGFNDIKDVSVLKKLPNLERISIEYNPIPESNWAFLKTWTQLKEIRLGGLKVSDISFLQNFKNLDFVSLIDNDITDITPLINNPGITDGDFVDVRNNYIPQDQINALKQKVPNAMCDPQNTTVPNPPSNLRVTSFSSTEITLQWEDGNDDWQYFAVARSDTQDFSSYTVVGTTTQKTFEDTTVASGNTYYYAVAAVNPVGNSSPTNSVKVTAMEDSEVTIPDAGLRQAILDALGKSSTPIYRSDLMSLTGLNASGRGITDLEGIQYCTNLQSFKLFNNNITNISKLASLTNLMYLSIQQNKNLSNIEPLEYLTNLKSLQIWEDNISDISALASLTNLQHIDISANPISSLDAIKNLKNITSLFIESNPIPASSIQFLETWTQLKELALGNLNLTINDIQFLSNLTNLQRLLLFGNHITNMSALVNLLSGMKNLQELMLDDNGITDITPLASLTSLTDLMVGFNDITDVSVLKQLPNLERISIEYNPIPESNWAFLKTRTQLKEIRLGGLKVSDISFLQNFTNLDFVSLIDNDITDIKPLINNPGITDGDFVDVRNNYIPQDQIDALKQKVPNAMCEPQNTTVPNPPYNLSVASFSSTEITLQWDDGNNDWQYFAIARSDTQDFSSYTVVGTTTQKTFEDTTVASGSTYYYAVAAVNPAGNSSPTSSVKVTAMKDSEVTIPDAGLRQAILDTLGKSSTPIYRSDLMSLTDLNASGRGITNLEGIQYCTNLQSLDLSNNNIATITQLASLTNLTSLNIWGNQIENISPIGNLIHLTLLSAGNNKINSISPLSNLTNLTTLWVDNNNIHDLTPIENLSKITQIAFGANPIPLDNWSFIKNWNARLTQLTIYGMDLTDQDIAFIANFTNLTNLDLSGNHLTSISVLSSLTNLRDLSLGFNDITDVSVLKHLPNLERISIEYNPIPESNWAFLKTWTQLKEIRLGGLRVSDISFLRNFTNLDFVSLIDNDITDITPLINNPGITDGDFVDVRNNYIPQNQIDELKQKVPNAMCDPQNTTVPQPPSSLRVTSFSSTQITLQWDDDNNDWQYFAVARSDTQDFSSYTVVGTTTQKTFEDTTVASGSTYYYVVAAVNPAGNSSPTSSVKVTAMKDSEVTIPDAGLRQAILDTLGKSSTPIYRSDLMSLTRLDASNRGITNLEGIQYCTNLQSLHLFNNDIKDISKLASLTSLKTLDLNTNHVDSFQALSGLVNLTNLDVRANDALDLSPLSNLHNLTALFVGATNSGSPQTNWQFIKDLNNLQQLSMPGMGLTNNDIQFLSGFSQLNWLDLGGNKITDISPLKGLDLQWGLDLSSNNIQNIEVLEGMTNLGWLRLDHNPIGNNGLSVIKNLTSLRDLELRDCGITDITPLENLSNLNTLALSNNEITDISPLMTNGLFTSGADLDISNNYLDISDGSTTMNDINTLQSGGVNVTYQPQKGQPQPPYNLSIVSFSSTQITLQWEDGNDDWQYFAIECSTDDTNYTQIATTATLTYEDTKVSSGDNYYYKVAAVNPIGYSDWTTPVSTTASNH